MHRRWSRGLPLIAGAESEHSHRCLHQKIWKSKFSSESQVSIFIFAGPELFSWHQTKWIVKAIWGSEVIAGHLENTQGGAITQWNMWHQPLAESLKYARENWRIPRRSEWSQGGGVKTKMMLTPEFISTTLLLLLLGGSVSATGKWTFIIQDYITRAPT